MSQGARRARPTPRGPRVDHHAATRAGIGAAASAHALRCLLDGSIDTNSASGRRRIISADRIDMDPAPSGESH